VPTTRERETRLRTAQRVAYAASMVVTSRLLRSAVLGLAAACAAEDDAVARQTPDVPGPDASSVVLLNDALEPDASGVVLPNDVLSDDAGEVVPSEDTALVEDVEPAPDDLGAEDSAVDDAQGDLESADVPPMDTADVPEADPCPAGLECITTFPARFESTTVGAAAALNGYSCAAATNEGGPERVWAVVVPEDGFLSAAVTDGAGVDVDVHLLAALAPSACLSRGDHHARADVSAGLYYVVVDSYVKADGDVQEGDFTLDVGFLVPTIGDCAMNEGIMKRVGDGGDHLAMPATGPMVLEAHLVTQDEPPPYPASASDELSAHYALSQAATGLVMARSQDWAPLEGGSFYGAGIGSPTLLPVVEEGWYVNMYWTAESRPPRGTKMIARLPGSSRAVVVAAGHETGPGNLTRIGGTPEETHFYLGTTHLSEMVLGIATDQLLPFGPRRCE
jgi:hypothetical protein